MSTFIACLQANSSIFLCGEEETRCSVGDFFDSKRVKICSYGRDFNATVSWPLHVVSSTSSRSREPSRRNNRVANPKQGGSSSSKAVVVLPGDMGLLRDLQEFISSADLPPHQVPSIRELAKHGRQDLANAVRRRGDKAVSQLLANPNFLNSGIASKPSKPIPVVTVSGTSKPSTSNGVLKPEVVPTPSNAPETSDLVFQNGTAPLVPGIGERRPIHPLQQKDRTSIDSPSEPTTRFSSIRPRDDEGRRNQVVPRTPDVAKLSQMAAQFDEGDSDDEDNTDLYTYEDSSDDEEDNNWSGPKPTGGFPESRESEAWQKAAMLRTKLQSFFDNPIDKGLAKPQRELGIISDIMAKQRETEKVTQYEQQGKESLSAFRTDPARELDRLTALLHSKEMENLRVSRELEEVKALLALVRARHAAELAQAKQVAVEKDLRLQAAEQALHSLKLVRVDWWGEGNRVQLAGSFNGWEHHVYLLPDLSSEIPQLDNSRGSMLWGVELWLYPGVYEIKFIVDGKWQLDHRREIVQRHMGQNNLLYVEL